MASTFTQIDRFDQPKTKDDVIQFALEIFDNDDRTVTNWLHRQNAALDGQIPIYLLETPAGIKSVYSILVRIATGVYS
jgi:uncharacterized protein (DUF2384 family)